MKSTNTKASKKNFPFSSPSSVEDIDKDERFSNESTNEENEDEN